MLTVSNIFDIQLRQAEVQVPNNAPVWSAQPTPAFTAGTAGSYALQVTDPENNPITISWAPDSAVSPSWLTIVNSSLVANGSQLGQIINGLKLRATDSNGNFTDSNVFNVTCVGWSTVPNISFTLGVASEYDLESFYIGFNRTTQAMQIASGELDGVTLEGTVLTYDGVGAAGSSTFRIDVISTIGGQVGLSTVIPLKEDASPDGFLWGADKNSYMRRLYLGWRRRGSFSRYGDYKDKNGVEYGTAPWASLSMPRNATAWRSFDVTELVQKWITTKKNKGFFIFTTSGQVKFASRNTGATEDIPYLSIVAGGKTYTILCYADCAITKSTGSDRNKSTETWCDSTSESIISYYLLDSVKETTITSATLNMKQRAISSSGTANVVVFEIDAQEATLLDGIRTPGIAEAYNFDEGLVNHPSVIDAFDFQERYVNINSPECKFFQGGTGQAGHRRYYYNEEVQSWVVELGWKPFGSLGSCNLEYGFFDSNDEPLYDEIYARYVIRYESPWVSTKSKIKQPGFSYRWGYRSQNTVDFSISSGNSGVRPNGLVSPHYDQWSPWVYRVDAGANRIYVQNKVRLANSGTPPPAIPPEGYPVTPLHFPRFWTMLGLEEGKTYYARNFVSGDDFLSSNVPMSFNVSETPTGPIVPLNPVAWDFENKIPAAGFGDPSAWNLWRHGGSFRSQLGYPDPDPTNPYRECMEMHSIINWPSMDGQNPLSQSEPERHWDYNNLQAVVQAGRWLNIEHHVKMNTIDMTNPDTFGGGEGNPDGEYDVWIDGQKVFEWRGEIFRHHPRVSVQSFWFDMYHGGGSSSQQIVDIYYTLARFVAATEYIGPMRGI